MNQPNPNKKKMAVVSKNFMANSGNKQVWDNKNLKGYIDAETKNQAIDRAELNRTGRIVSPKSAVNKNNAASLVSRHSYVDKETRSKEEMAQVSRAIDKAKGDAKHGAKPLIYLDNPDKLLGDLSKAVAPNNKFGFSTSEKERQELSYNTHNPYKSPNAKLNFSTRKGLEHVPGAVLNLAMAGEGAGASGMLRTLNNAVNPLAGSGQTLIRLKHAVNRGIGGRLTEAAARHEIKRTGAAVGTGLAKDEAKEIVLDKSGEKAVGKFDNLNFNLKESNISKDAKAFKLEKATPFRRTIEYPHSLKNDKVSAIDYIKNHFESPDTKERMVKSLNPVNPYERGKPNSIKELKVEESLKGIKEDLNEYVPKSYRDLLKEKPSDFMKLGFNTEGLSYGTPKEIYSKKSPIWSAAREIKQLFKKDKSAHGAFNKEGVLNHELSHLTNKNGDRFSYDEMDRLLEPFEENTFSQQIKSASNSASKDYKYYTDPTEIKARMDQARYLLNKKPGENFSPEDFEKITDDNDWFGMGAHIKDKGKFIKLMNSFYSGAGVIAAGSAVSKQKKQ